MESHHCSCKNCIFAEFKEKTQTGCRLGMLDKYRNHGIKVEECFDEDSEFFVIPNKTCMSKRNKGWKFHDDNLEAQLVQINEEIKPRFHVIVIPETIEQLENIIIGLIEQSEIPSFVTIINKCNLDPLNIIPMVSESGLNWELDNVIIDRKESELIHKHAYKRMIPYYVVIRGTFEDIELFSKLSDKILNLFDGFGCIKCGNIEAYSLAIHLFWYFNVLDHDFMEFLEKSQQETGKQWLINL